MKFLLAIISWFSINIIAFSQVEGVRFFTFDELSSANPDSVIAIDLQKQKLKTLPEEIFKFTKLQYLNLGKNEITDLDRIGTFKELKYLNLERNKLDHFPVVVCQLQKIEHLALGRNEFEKIPDCIETCTELKYLDLWATPVKSLPDCMTKLTKLEEIDFSEVQISKPGQEKLKEQFPNVKLILDSPCHCLD